jgi:hypothetical protein
LKRVVMAKITVYLNVMMETKLVGMDAPRIALPRKTLLAMVDILIYRTVVLISRLKLKA